MRKTGQNKEKRAWRWIYEGEEKKRVKDRKKGKEKLKESQIKEEYGEGEEMKINGIERFLLAGYQKRMSKRLKGRLRWKSLKTEIH